MTIGTSNRTTIGIIKETTAGVTPGNPALQLLRFTGEDIDSGRTTTQSAEIRNDRGLSDLQITDISNGGSLNWEKSAGTYDQLLEAVLMADSTWTVIDNGGENTISATATGFDDSANGFISNGLEVGCHITFTGFTNSEINKTYRVTSLTAGSIGTSPVPPATGSGGTVTYKGGFIKSGITDHSFTLQKAFNDLSPVVYKNFRGMRVSAMSMGLSIGALAQGSFTFLGESSEVSGSGISGQTLLPVTTTRAMNCVSNVTRIAATSDSLTSELYFTTLDFSYDNALRELKAIGVLGAVDIRPGTINASATVNPYFETREVLDAFADGLEFVVSWQMTDTDGNWYVYSLPRCVFETQRVVAGSEGTDLIVQSSVRALQDAASGCTMRIDRFLNP